MAPDGQHWDVGAYVLGVLDPAEIEPFEAHLAVCDYCADEVGSLLPIVGGLAVVDAAGITGDGQSRLASVTPLPAQGPHRRVRSLPRHGRLVPTATPRGRRLVAAAAAAVVVSGVSFLAGTQWATPGGDVSANPTTAPFTSTGAQQLEATDTATGVHARLGIVNNRWGSQIDLTVDGVRGPLRCELIAIGPNGRSTVVASWTVVEPGYGITEQPTPLRLEGATATTVDATSRFEIRGTSPSGTVATLVTLPV